MNAAPSALRVPLSSRLIRGRVVAVLRADAGTSYQRVVAALVEEGIDSIELTLTTPGTMAELPGLLERWSDRADIGVGTVRSVQQAEAVVAAGSRFVVSPAVDPEVIATVRDAGRAVIPGAMTPTEVSAAWAAGASAVKIFPASAVGPSYLRALHGPFPEVTFIPSGGVAVDDVAEWLDAGAAAVSLGGELLGDALRGGDLTDLRDRCRRCRRVLDRRADRRVS